MVDDPQPSDKPEESPGRAFLMRKDCTPKSTGACVLSDRTESDWPWLARRLGAGGWFLARHAGPLECSGLHSAVSVPPQRGKAGSPFMQAE